MRTPHETMTGLAELVRGLARVPTNVAYIEMLKRHPWDRASAAEWAELRALQLKVDPRFKTWNAHAPDLHKKVALGIGPLPRGPVVQALIGLAVCVLVAWIASLS